MSGTVNKDVISEVKYANWNYMYQDISKEITKIRRYGNVCVLNPKAIHQYYAMITGLYSCYSQSIREDRKMSARLEKIEDAIFSAEYVKDAQIGKVAGAYQVKVIRMLRVIFTEMNIDFSEAGLTPKIEKREVDTRPVAARNVS